MIAVSFEVKLTPGAQHTYLDLAAELRPLLEEVDGFISIERFASLSDPDKVLSLSFFRDEAAVLAWRSLEKHRTAQRAGGLKERSCAPATGKMIVGALAAIRARLQADGDRLAGRHEAAFQARE